VAGNLSATQLSGSYTINPAGTASATVFKDFTSAITYLTSASARTDGGPANSAPFGVSGAVRFNVAAATYTEQITVPAITGTSGTNTVTFSGGNLGKTTRIMTFNGASNYATVYLNGCSYVRFDNLSIIGTSTTNQQVVTVGSSCNFNTFNQCIITCGGSTAPTSGSSNFNPVVLSSSTTNIFSSASNSTNNYFDSCTISNGFYGYFQQATTGTQDNGFRFCKIQNYANSGSYCWSGFNIIYISDTIVGRAGTAQYGFYFGNFNGSSTQVTHIRNCTVSQNSFSGLYCATSLQSFSSGNPAFITNNIFRGPFTSSNSYGVYGGYWGNVNFWHNTIVMDNAVTSGAAFYWPAGGTGVNIRNNHFIHTNASATAAPFFWGGGSGMTIDYNNIFTANSGGVLANVGGSTFTSSNFRGAGGYNTNSDNQNPSFVSSTNLTPQAPCISGIYIANANVTNDYDNIARSNPPKIGAKESVSGSVNNDIGITQITSQTLPHSTGSQNIVAILRNFGSNSITSASIQYTVNGGSPVIQAWTGSLAACGTTTITFSGGQQFNFATGLSTIVVSSSLPNGVSDVNASNNSTTKIVHTPLSGTYWINNTGSGIVDFASFTAAANALNNGSLTGPVRFRVVPSTYTERIDIGAVVGSSSTNRIRFVGNSTDSSLTVLRQTATGTGDNFTVRITGTSFISFSKMTLQSLSSSFGTIVSLTNSSNDSFNNCQFLAPTYTFGTTNAISLSLSSATELNTVVNNNYFSGGSYGYYDPSSSTTITGTVIRDNVFLNQGGYFIYLSYPCSNLVVQRNNMRTNTTNTGFQGVYLQSTQNSLLFERNNIYCANGQYGIQFWNTSASLSTPSLFRNNMVYLGGTTGNAAAFYFGACNFMWLYHNTFVYGGTGSNAAALFNSSNSSSSWRDNRLVNNILALTNNTGTKYCFHDQATHTAGNEPFKGTNGLSNFNDYYAPSGFTNLNRANATNFTTLASWQSSIHVTGSNSITVDPQFTSLTAPFDLHITNTAGMNATGTNALTLVPNDFDGAVRTSSPDMGADEVTPAGTDLGVVNMIPNPMPSGPQTVQAVIQNFGTTNISSCSIRWYVAGALQPLVGATFASLSPSSSATISLGTFTFTAGTSVTIAGRSYLPNTIADGGPANDSFTQVSCPGMGGTYTIGGTSPNFATFGAAVTAMASGCGISGPIVFKVRSGTYNERIDIGTLTQALAISSSVVILFPGFESKSALESESTHDSTQIRPPIFVKILN
jgi:hypothetical protein